MRLIIESISRLAASPADQMRYLSSLSSGGDVSVDELALDFSEAIDISWQALDAGELKQSDMNSLNKLNQRLREMSGLQNLKLWNSEALATSAEWSEIREIASNCLRQIT